MLTLFLFDTCQRMRYLAPLLVNQLHRQVAEGDFIAGYLDSDPTEHFRPVSVKQPASA